jgi:hypothetical protein
MILNSNYYWILILNKIEISNGFNEQVIRLRSINAISVHAGKLHEKSD